MLPMSTILFYENDARRNYPMGVDLAYSPLTDQELELITYFRSKKQYQVYSFNDTKTYFILRYKGEE